MKWCGEREGVGGGGEDAAECRYMCRVGLGKEAGGGGVTRSLSWEGARDGTVRQEGGGHER